METRQIENGGFIVNDVLTRKLRPPRQQAKHQRDVPELAAGVKRFLNGLAWRISQGDVEGLRELADLQEYLEALTGDAIYRLRHEQDRPFSWAEIGQALGVTKQAAQQRYGRNE